MPEEKPKIHIDSLSWGEVVVNGQKFDQAIIAKDRATERDREKLEKLFGTTHVIGDWEQDLLLAENPEVIVVGNGWSGVLRVSDEIKAKLVSSGAELKILLTPAVISEFNKLVSQGKQVNALIHTTC